MQKTLFFCENNLTFDQQYLITGLKNQSVEKLSLDLIFIDNFHPKYQKFCKQNSMLRIHSKLTEFTPIWTENDKNFQFVLS